VQPLDTWREMWVFRQDATGLAWSMWLPPATDNPDLGYVEFAGWVPGSAEAACRARDAFTPGRYKTELRGALAADAGNEAQGRQARKA
jgi:hypothetical protein